MARPLTDAEREHIVELLNDGLTRNEVARASGKAPSTVTKVARAVGHDFLAACDEATQSSLTRAHAARSAFCAESRAVDGAAMQLKVRGLIADFNSKQPVVIAPGLVEDVKPDARAMKDRAQAIQLLQRTVLEISKHDVKPDEGVHKGLFSDFSEQLRVARER